MAAVHFLEEVLEAADSLGTLSNRGRSVPELEGLSIREVFVRRYRLIYAVGETQVTLLAFVHSARDFANWRNQIEE